jgi:parallel beta-helix repeat protein
MMDQNHSLRLTLIVLGAALLAVQTAVAATLCVNPGGSKGCFASIGAAVAAASPNDTINVAQGTYKEDVVIGKPLSLIGFNQANTTIDATGLPNGVYVDGIDNPGLSNVVVTGFTIKNANFEGILVTNSSFVTVWSNNVTNNDLNLEPSIPACPGIPDFETGEAFDCGEGVHLIGVDHSTVADNIVANNAGGILLSDDTGQTHDNLVTGNLSQDNPFDCGIVMASHAPGPGSTAPHLGVVRNTIAGNTSTHNGFQVPGAGAGVGVFADGSGPGLVSGNVVTQNTLTNNGLPGVAFHSHVGPNFGAPPDNLSDNVIIGNTISGNGADLFDTATPGTTGININSGGGGSPITGTVISQNVIKGEADNIVVNTPAYVDIHLNNLLGKQTGIDAFGGATVNATENWWGCSGGPGANGCASVSGTGILSAPWLTKPF